MKYLILLALTVFPALLFGESNTSQTVEINLGEAVSFKIYENLQVGLAVEEGGKRLVKRGQNITCSRLSYYPGDFEYSCQMTLLMNEQGVSLTE